MTGGVDEAVESDDSVAAVFRPGYYACHEGNEGLKGILAGARADEPAATRDLAQNNCRAAALLSSEIVEDEKGVDRVRSIPTFTPG
jgi:hypothetical protein